MSPLQYDECPITPTQCIESSLKRTVISPFTPVQDINDDRKRQLSPRTQCIILPSKKVPRVHSPTSSISTEIFVSVLDRPFAPWNEIDVVFAALVPEWTKFIRGKLIHHLIHFLELKVSLNEYLPGNLLIPSPLIDKAWKALIIETLVYRRVIKTIQDFHGRPHKMIHYSIFTTQDGDVETKFQRTQSLFQLYYKERMPCFLQDVCEEEMILMPNDFDDQASVDVSLFGTEFI